MPGRRLVYSIGYEKRTIDDFVAALAAAGVDVLVDVRLTPMSRRPGFSKSRLKAALAQSGIEYRHEPLLGNPRDNREAFQSGDVELGRERFRARLTDGAAGVMEGLASLVTCKSVAIMCVERDEEHCHRQVIVERLLADNPSLVPIRL